MVILHKKKSVTTKVTLTHFCNFSEGLMERSDKPPLSTGGLEGLSICKQLNCLRKLYTKKERHREGNAHTLL